MHNVPPSRRSGPLPAGRVDWLRDNGCACSLLHRLVNRLHVPCTRIERAVTTRAAPLAVRGAHAWASRPRLLAVPAVCAPRQRLAAAPRFAAAAALLGGALVSAAACCAPSARQGHEGSHTVHHAPMLATPAAAAAERGAPALPSDVVLITCVGSEFALKGLLALEVAGVTYTNVNLSITSLGKYLPSPSQVPVLCWGTEVVADSTAILRFLDVRAGTHFFPPADTAEGKRVAEIEELSDTVLSPYLRYYALVDPDGFARGLWPKVRHSLPLGLGALLWPLARLSVGPYKAALQRAVPSLDTDSPAAVREGLASLLATLNAGLPSESAGYLAGTPAISAADVAVASLLQRLASTSFDADIAPCLPGALDATPKLKAWLRRIEAELPDTGYLKRVRAAGAPRPPALLRDV